MAITGQPSKIQDLCWLWVRFYTLGLPGGIRDDRRHEIASDNWEFSHDSRSTGYRLGVQLLLRVLRGVPADIRWRFDQGGDGGWAAVALLLGLFHMAVGVCAWLALPVRTSHPIGSNVVDQPGVTAEALQMDYSFGMLTRSLLPAAAALCLLGFSCLFLAIEAGLAREGARLRGAAAAVFGSIGLGLFLAYSELGPLYVAFVAGEKALGYAAYVPELASLWVSGAVLCLVGLRFARRAPLLATALAIIGTPSVTLAPAWFVASTSYSASTNTAALGLSLAYPVLIAVLVGPAFCEVFLKHQRLQVASA